jgi:hypothetical protein
MGIERGEKTNYGAAAWMIQPLVGSREKKSKPSLLIKDQ